MEKVSFINLTPHKIFEVNTGLEIEPSGKIARVAVQYTEVDRIENIPLYKAEYGSVENLPAPTPNVIYIVSGMVKAHPDVVNRKDVVAPGNLVRDEEGKPVGCDGFKL